MKPSIFKYTLAAALVLTSAAWAAGADGETTGSFFRAVRRDSDMAVASALKKGVSPNLQDAKGNTGLHVALLEGMPVAAAELLKAPQLDVNVLNNAGESILMMAALKSHVDVARTLIERGAAINKDGWTPLHYAATGGNTDIMNMLLDKGAQLDARSPNGTTPLMMAARYGSTKAVELLLQKGADPKLTNEQKLTALDFARLGQRPDAIKILEKLAAK